MSLPYIDISMPGLKRSCNDMQTRSIHQIVMYLVLTILFMKTEQLLHEIDILMQ
jgi:hypothetical protein